MPTRVFRVFVLNNFIHLFVYIFDFLFCAAIFFSLSARIRGLEITLYRFKEGCPCHFREDFIGLPTLARPIYRQDTICRLYLN